MTLSQECVDTLGSMQPTETHLSPAVGSNQLQVRTCCRQPSCSLLMDGTAPLLCSEEEDLAGASLCTLLLTTMAGNEITIEVPISTHHNWEMLEDYVGRTLACCRPTGHLWV